MNIIQAAEAEPADARQAAVLDAAVGVFARYGFRKTSMDEVARAAGVAFEGLDEHLMLKARPGVFCAGEMLDWEAPTGGYLLQASFATGVAAARGVLAWLG